MKYLIFLSVFLIYGVRANAQSDTLQPLPKYLWNIKWDASRLVSAMPSAQMSVAYRFSDKIGFESELNYYLSFKNKERATPFLDELKLELDKGRPNLFLSGILKRYFSASGQDPYIALRGAVGMVNFDIERRICVDAQLSESGEVCLCKEVETRKADLRKNLFLGGLRFGADFRQDRWLLDLYIDVSIFRISKNVDYEEFIHQSCEKALSYAWRDIYYGRRYMRPKTDGIFNDLTSEDRKYFVTYGLKFGYAF